MLMVLAALSGMATIGCQPVGRTVHCDLADPVPLPVAATTTASTAPGHPRPAVAPARGVLAVRAPRATPVPPTPDAIARHVEQLVAIGDCTGARTLAESFQPGAGADGIYRACAGFPAVAVAPAALAGGAQVAASR